MLSLVTKTVNYIRGCALNYLEFFHLLEDMYNKFYTEIRWLFYHKVLKRFQIFKEKLILFIKMKCQESWNNRRKLTTRFCLKILKVDHVLRFITKTVNYIRGCALNHLAFIQLLEDVYNKFSDISVYTEIRWLFYHKVL